MRRATVLLVWAVAVFLTAGGCETEPAGTGGDAAVTGDTKTAGDGAIAGDAAGGGGDAATTTGACGPDLTCQAPQACQILGQGACGGPAPAANGTCAPGCTATECGGGMHCLCDSYECIDLQAGCTGCDCKWTDWHTSCACDDSTGVVVLDCPGA